MLLLLVLFAFDTPEILPCVVDMCEIEVCVIETPEGIVEVPRKPSYYEGKRLPLDECPMDQIDPT